MFCTAWSSAQLTVVRGSYGDRRTDRAFRCARPGKAITRTVDRLRLRCDASGSSSDDEEGTSFVPDRLPLAGADTDWREFRARLVASEASTSREGGEPGTSNSGAGILDDDGEAAEQRQQQEGFWAHALPGPEKGGLLLAHPLMFDSSQRYFQKSVIYLFEHGPDGSAGVILNLPTGHTIGSLGTAAGSPEFDCPEFKTNVLHLGGDVGDNTLHMLHSCANLEGAMEVASGIHMGGYDAALTAVREGKAQASSFKWFAKYAGWGPGQLEREVDAGVWYTAAAGKGVVLQQVPAAGGASMWHQVLELMGGEFKQLSEAAKGEYRPDIMGHSSSSSTSPFGGSSSSDGSTSSFGSSSGGGGSKGPDNGNSSGGGNNN